MSKPFAGAEAASPSPAFTALVVGAHRPIDQALPARPGVTPSLHRLVARLTDGGLRVRGLLDDARSEVDRPLGGNLLAALSALPAGALVVLSGAVREGRFLPRDAHLAHLKRTGLPLDELLAAAPADAVVVLDLAQRAADLPEAPHLAALAAAAPEDAPERGPSNLLRALIGGLASSENPRISEIFERLRAAGACMRVAADRPLLPHAPGALPPRACRACGAVVTDASAAFCPTCGAALGLPERLDDGRYVLVRPIGAGGMGQVWLAEDTRLQVQRAIKLMSLPPRMPPQAAAQLRSRLLLEARAAQVVGERSRGVVRVFDVGHCAERDEPFIVMELLQGETLGARLARGLPAPAVGLALARAVAEALAAVHGLAFVHRDLKPENIMLCVGDAAAAPPEVVAAALLQPGAVKLIDFGLVKTGQLEGLTASGHMLGTLQYMPPEQLRGELIDARADVFSLGAVIYECLSGARANPGTSLPEVARLLFETGAVPLAERAAGLDPQLCALVDRCLRLDRNQRPADAAEVARALATLAGNVPSGGTLAGVPSPAHSGTDLPSAPTLALTTSAPPAVPPAPVASAPSAPAIASLASSPRSAPSTPNPAPTLDSGFGPAPQPARRGPVLLAVALTAAAAALVFALVNTGAPTPDAGPARVVVPQQPEVGVLAAQGHAAADAAHGRAAAEAALRPDTALDAAHDTGPEDAALADATPVAADGAAAAAPTPDPKPLGRKVNLRGLGALRLAAEGSVTIEQVRCAQARPGDRLRAARWTLPGYDAGRCAGEGCPAALARVLQQAADVAETLRLRLELSRPAAKDEGGTRAPAAELAVDCLVRP